MRASETNLLERAGELRALSEQFDSVLASARGHVTFIAGEAGVGKTELVRRFASELPSSATVVWGACDALATPRPLGPFVDVAGLVGGELDRLARTEARPHEFAAELMRELRERAPVVIVLEDLQWADAATLDVLRLLARRVESVGALILCTHRDDELDRIHPLRRTMGELATSAAVSRLRVPRLSPEAVASLAQPYGIDAAELYRQTGGKPLPVPGALPCGTRAGPPDASGRVLAQSATLRAPPGGGGAGGPAISPPAPDGRSRPRATPGARSSPHCSRGAPTRATCRASFPRRSTRSRGLSNASARWTSP